MPFCFSFLVLFFCIPIDCRVQCVLIICYAARGLFQFSTLGRTELRSTQATPALLDSRWSVVGNEPCLDC